MYAVAVELELKPGTLEAFLPLMMANAHASTGTEPGCRQFDVCSKADQPDHLFLFELYDDKAAFEHHLTTEHFRAFDAAGGAMIAATRLMQYDTVMR